MKIPMLKAGAFKLEKLVETNQSRVILESKASNQQIYATTGKGQWEVCKDLGKQSASTLIAVKRSEKGPKGQAKNTVATDPDGLTYRSSRMTSVSIL